MTSTDKNSGPPPFSKVQGADLMQADEVSRKSDYRRAIAIYHTVLRTEPGNVRALFGRSIAYEKLDSSDLNAALKDVEKVVALKPDWCRGYLRQGQIFLQKKNLLRAETVIKKAREHADWTEIYDVDRLLDEVRDRTAAYLSAQTSPSSTKRIRLVPTPANPVGIRNLGSTGYLSVVLQTFYFITAIPQAIFRKRAPRNSMIWALQRLLYLLRTSFEPVSLRELTDSFGWSSRELNEQQDCHELFVILLDRLSSETIGINAMFRHQIATRITWTDVDWRSCGKEFAYTVNLRISEQMEARGSEPRLRSLDQSFRKYLEPVLCDGKTKCYAGENFGLQRAHYSTTFEDFPNVMWVRLQRYEYMLSVEKMCKVHKYFEYPEEFDASHYLHTTSQGSEPWLYSLITVIVHLGNLDRGIYFSFTRPSLDGPYYELKNEHVAQVSKDEALDKNFGSDRLQSGYSDEKTIEKTRLLSSRTA